MLTVNIHEAKTQLSKLVAMAAAGEPFVIARAGKPLVIVSAIQAEPARKPKRIGFLAGTFTIPDEPGRFPEDLPPDEQAELERLWHEGPLFPPEASDDIAA